MTDKRYFDNPLTLEFTATVQSIIQNGDNTSMVILDKTYFYPTGGGQSHDVGTLNDCPVIDVTKDGETVLHKIEGTLEAGEVVGKIDKSYRRGNMQAHTGQHILSAIALRDLKAETLAVKMSATGLSTVDIDKPDLTSTQIELLENAVNLVITDNHPVKSYFVAPDSPKLDKLRRAVKFDKVSGDVRLVEIVDVDLSACAGTHVPETGMLGLLKILKVDNYKGGSRIYFAVGDEAMRQFNHYQQVLDSVANLLSAGTGQVVELIEKLQSERSDLAKQLADQTEKLLSYEAQSLIEETQTEIIVQLFDNRSNDDLRTLANLITTQGKNVVFANQADNNVTLIVASSDNSELHAGNTLKAILAEFEGRGGGRDTYAQGVLKEFGDIETLQEVIGRQLSE